MGAAVCVYLDGVRVVDCWGGHADAARTRPFGPDTIVSVASTTKGMVALCAHMLAERGKLDLDAPVARYWPEFAAAGKQDIPVRWLLSHRAGLPAIRPSPARGGALRLERDDRGPRGDRALVDAGRAARLSRDHLRPPGRRGHPPRGRPHRGRVPSRRGHRPAARRLLHRRARGGRRRAPPRSCRPRPPGEATIWDTLLADPESVSGRTFLNPPRTADLVNTRAWRAAEIPAANGHTSARGVARVYAALARGGELDGVRLLAPATIDRAIEEQSRGRDEVLTLPTRFATGFMLGMPGGIFECGPGRRSFGHPGRGGSIGFADPDARVGFGYVTNQYVTGTAKHPDRRVLHLVDAVYEALR